MKHAPRPHTNSPAAPDASHAPSSNSCRGTPTERRPTCNPAQILPNLALTSILERHGIKVVYAENGREVVERLQQHANTDLVLLDIMMPEMDGYETARSIRSMPGFEQLPIISLTAKALKGDREQALDAGASDYIAKPVDVDELVAMMRAWLVAGEPARLH